MSFLRKIEEVTLFDKMRSSKTRASTSPKKMGACWEAISANDRRMLNYEILKKKNFRFPVKKLMRNIFWEKRVWNFKHCQYIYLIENIVTDHNKQKHPIQT